MLQSLLHINLVQMLSTTQVFSVNLTPVNNYEVAAIYSTGATDALYF